MRVFARPWSNGSIVSRTSCHPFRIDMAGLLVCERSLTQAELALLASLLSREYFAFEPRELCQVNVC